MDSIARHTPGPLHVDQRPDASPDQFTIASNYMQVDGNWDDVYVSLSGYCGSYGPHVFAAAPDLREALHELRNECGSRPRPDRLIALLAKADAALAKAEGRTDA